MITQQVLDSSPTFHLRWAADESRAPTVIGEHWIDHLDAGGHIAKCKPHDFKFEDEWLPLYTRAGITRHVSGLSSLLKTQGDSPLVAVMPPDMLFWSDREYVIHKLHKEDCLSRVTIYYGENLHKQIAFCPYCGVTNENTATTYSHARKHLGITFLCGGCYTKLYKAPQHLSQHMKTCPPCLMNRPEGSWQSVRKKYQSYHPHLSPTRTQRFSWCRDLRRVSVIETYGLRFSETYGLLYVMFDFWRLSPHRLKCLIYYVAIYNEIN